MTKQAYSVFLGTKRIVTVSTGIEIDASTINTILFPFQRDLTLWAIRKGRSAIFADTGLGKSFMQVEWARLISRERALIVAPLSVAKQTVNEADKIGVEVHYTRSGDDLSGDINITNYEMVHKFDASQFDAVVLDESSILKSLDGKTRHHLTEMFAETPYRLCCTATPAPNDISEIANHAEFLGIMKRTDMLATFFVHDDNGWRLKGHAQEPFYRWMASWGMSVRKPNDLGYSDDGFDLPPLNIMPLWVQSDYRPEGQLFFSGLSGIQGRAEVRRATMPEKVAATAEMVNADPGQWIIWCGLNDESKALAAAIDRAVEVKGGDSLEYKEDALDQFKQGIVEVLVTKPKIAGFGMNFQNAHKMAFVGLSDSWESYYQAIRRCWRFGQTKPVNVHIVLSDIEETIYHNVMRKEREAKKMSEQLIANVQRYEQEELEDINLGKFDYREDEVAGDGWRMLLGDSVERMGCLEDESISLSVFSPPFMSLYTYSSTERDLGNSNEGDQFFEHFGYIIDELMRVTKPGRNCAVHVADVPALQVKDGYIGLKDFPGMTIKAFEERGWIYHGRTTIDKNPQAQAIRTHSKGLLFVQMKKDSSWSRPAIGDYILVFRKPGDNAVPIQPDISNDMWIEWAHPVWYGIKESDTLQYSRARGDDDERHICPLQLGTIERCIRLWSNKGETVLSPFAGIGSEGHQAILLGRQFVGIELKPEYYRVALNNLQDAEREAHTEDLFTLAGIEVA